MIDGILMYGPPASGKDTVTAALAEVDSRYKLFPRLKSGPGRTDGYRMTNESELSTLRMSGGVVWENRRYGAIYVIDKIGLLEYLHSCVPIVHLGQPEGVSALVDAFPGARWLTVYLYCPRSVAVGRIRSRNTSDDEARLLVWDTTPPIDQPDLAFDTAEVPSAVAAASIHARVTTS